MTTLLVSSDPVISLPLNRLNLVDITNPLKGFIIMNLCHADMAPLLVALCVEDSHTEFKGMP